MAEKYKVLLVEVLPKAAQKIRGLLERIDFIELIPNSITNSEIALETIRLIKPDIVLLDMDLPGLNGIQCAEIIKRENPVIQVIILSEVSSAETVRLAMRAGASDFLNYNSLTPEELYSVLDRSAKIINQEKNRFSTRVSPQSAPPIEVKKPSKRDGKIITIYSPKGGSGVSTMAVNLGYALKSLKEDTRVIIVDLDLQHGDIAILFNQMTNRSIIDLAIRVQNLDEELVESVVFSDDSTNVDMIAAPNKLDISNEIDPNNLPPILTQLSAMYDYVIINSSKHLTETLFTCFGQSNLIVIPILQLVTSIRAVRSTLLLFNEIGIGKDKVMLVVNRFTETSTISPKKIGEMLSLSVSHLIPTDNHTAEKAVNLGIPFTYDNKKAEISKAIYTLAEMVQHKSGRAHL